VRNGGGSLHRRLAALLIAGAILTSAGCSGGDSPTTPSPPTPPPTPTAPSPPTVTGPANVAGTWSGTLTFNGTIAQGPVTLTLTQVAGAAAVSGTWSGKNKWTGTIDGSVSGNTFAGQLVWKYEGSGQGLTQCVATAALSGNAGGSAITWTSSLVAVGANQSVFCNLGVTSLRIDATK
jgi:hypothetical protein